MQSASRRWSISLAHEPGVELMRLCRRADAIEGRMTPGGVFRYPDLATWEPRGETIQDVAATVLAALAPTNASATLNACS